MVTCLSPVGILGERHSRPVRSMSQLVLRIGVVRCFAKDCGLCKTRGLYQLDYLSRASSTLQHEDRCGVGIVPLIGTRLRMVLVSLKDVMTSAIISFDFFLS